MSGKIRKSHLERQVYVYLRQSSPGQVENNQESTRRQYSLADRAIELGWDRSQVHILDGDLGKSGSSTNLRGDFHKLMASVGLGQVGAVFAIEVSRFSRSQADWHRLVEVCALTDTLVVDHDGVYDPNDFNDRVLLGFKGTWSHTELHGMKVRLQGAKISKAKRGELRCKPPVGYVYDQDGHLVIDPDEGVASAVTLFFRKFQEYGSAFQVCRYFFDNQIAFPCRDWSVAGNRLHWRCLEYQRVLSILHNPTYAGVYAYGKSKGKVTVSGVDVIRKRALIKSRGDWMVLNKDAHPGYISWETFLENERQLLMNCLNSDVAERKGAPKVGSALLQGIVICGRCGRRMTVLYQGERGKNPSYVCSMRHRTVSSQPICWSVPTKYIDQTITDHLIEVLTEQNLSLSLAVVGDIEKNAKEESRQWELRLERAKYEADRAWRQYDAIEPENRLVARSLEKQWNEKLQALEELKQRQAESQQSILVKLTNAEREEVLRICKDFRQLWSTSTTTQVERKQILALLVKQVSIKPLDVPKRETEIQLLWHTGAHTQLKCPRPKTDLTRRTPPAIVDRIRELSANLTDSEIAQVLNDSGLRPLKGAPFTLHTVTWIRHAYRIEKIGADPAYAKKGKLYKDKYYSVSGLATRLGLQPQVIHYWRRRGVLKGIQEARQGPWWIEFNPEDIHRLNQRMKKQKLLPTFLQGLLGGNVL